MGTPELAREISEQAQFVRMPDSSGFTEDQLADFQECFLLFDTKGDTRIPVKQVGDVLRALGQNPTESDVKKLVQSSGQGKADGRVTFEQSLPMLQEGNGRISAVELRHLLVGLGEKMTEEEVEVLIHGKEDAQGNINYEEFVRMVLAQ